MATLHEDGCMYCHTAMDELEEPMDSTVSVGNSQDQTPRSLNETAGACAITTADDDTPTTSSTDEAVAPFRSPHIQQITMAEYYRHADDYTQQALRELKASPEYQRHTQHCKSCNASWYLGQWSEGCEECGGFPMHRPCPICRGLCGKSWTRSVDLSHSMSFAHWDGTCGHQQAAALIIEKLTFNNLSEAMEDLRT